MGFREIVSGANSRQPLTDLPVVRSVLESIEWSELNPLRRNAMQRYEFFLYDTNVSLCVLIINELCGIIIVVIYRCNRKKRKEPPKLGGPSEPNTDEVKSYDRVPVPTYEHHEVAAGYIHGRESD